MAVTGATYTCKLDGGPIGHNENVSDGGGDLDMSLDEVIIVCLPVFCGVYVVHWGEVCNCICRGVNMCVGATAVSDSQGCRNRPRFLWHTSLFMVSMGASNDHRLRLAKERQLQAGGGGNGQTPQKGVAV